MPELVEVMPGTPEWLAARRAGVTATDIVTICGLSPHDSAYALYWRKLGATPDVADSDRFRLGRHMEPYAAGRWLEAHPGSFLNDRALLFRSAERPWQMATIDRETLVYETERDTNATIVHGGEPVELKSWADADRRQWDDGPVPAVRAQLLWQMDVMGAVRGHVGVVFLPSGEFRSYTVDHAPQTHLLLGAARCEICCDLDFLRIKGDDFMWRIQEGNPPSVDASAATLAALKARFAGTRDDKTAVIADDLWLRYYHACKAVNLGRELKKQAENEMREVIGECGLIEVGGTVVARRQRYTVKAHMRRESTVDKIVRVKNKEEDDAEDL
jgi:putative phage-type endonuclease